jgi:hypothetical protein
MLDNSGEDYNYTGSFKPRVDPSLLARMLAGFNTAAANPEVQGMVSNIGANMFSQPGASPRGDVFHGLNRAVQGTLLADAQNKAIAGGTKLAAIPAPVGTDAQVVTGAQPQPDTRRPVPIQQPAPTEANKNLNKISAKAPVDEQVKYMEGAWNNLGKLMIAHPPQGSTAAPESTAVDPYFSVDNSLTPAPTPIEAAPEVAPTSTVDELALSAIIKMLANPGVQKDTSTFEGYLPNPGVVGNAIAGLGFEAGMAPYKAMFEAEKVRAASGARDMALREHAIKLATLPGEIEANRALATERRERTKNFPMERRKLEEDIAKTIQERSNLLPENQALIAGGKTTREEEAKWTAKNKAINTELDAFASSDAGKEIIPTGILTASNLKPGTTWGQAAKIYGRDNLHTLSERYTSYLNSNTGAGATVQAAKETGAKTVMGILAMNVRDLDDQISTLSDSKRTLLMSEPDKAANAAVLASVTRRRDTSAAEMANIQNFLTPEAAKVSPGTAAREKAKGTAPAQTEHPVAKAYGLPSAVPKGSGVKQILKSSGKEVYIVGGAAYDANGNFIDILSDKSKKK